MMNTFLQHIWQRYPLVIEPCEEHESGEKMVFEAPENNAIIALIAPLSECLYHCGISHNEEYDSDVWLLPVADCLRHIDALTVINSATRTLLMKVRHWQKNSVTLLRLNVAHRYYTFETEQQIWGHESNAVSEPLRKRARELTRDCCDLCGYSHPEHTLRFRDGNPENDTDNNLGVCCAVCLFSTRLNRLSANDGVMVYLPTMAPEDVSHLLRTLALARREGNERQKKDAASILNWLISHREETEAYWGTSHPGEFGQALLSASPELRETLQQRLRHVALIVNPELLLNHSNQSGPPLDAWPQLSQHFLCHD